MRPNCNLPGSNLLPKNSGKPLRRKCNLNQLSHTHGSGFHGQADEGVGRRPGGPPHKRDLTGC